MALTVKAQLSPTAEITLSHNAHFASLGYMSGESLFKSMGFESVHALDYSDFEGAEIIHDLNSSELPIEFHEKFDVIIDHGTLEHVFHVPNALMNLFKLLKPGGRLIHSLPTSNLVDHGFYMFSPTFFYDFYTTNNWEINNIYVVSMTPRQETEPFFYTEYEPGSFDSVSYGGLSAGMYITLSFLTKTPESTAHLVPQQGVYKRDPRWVQDSKQFRDESSKSARVVGSVKHGLKQLISKLVS
jgi:SAM-dependent methyltransferase